MVGTSLKKRHHIMEHELGDKLQTHPEQRSPPPADLRSRDTAQRTHTTLTRCEIPTLVTINKTLMTLLRKLSVLHTHT